MVGGKDADACLFVDVASHWMGRNEVHVLMYPKIPLRGVLAGNPKQKIPPFGGGLFTYHMFAVAEYE